MFSFQTISDIFFVILKKQITIIQFVSKKYLLLDGKSDRTINVNYLHSVKNSHNKTPSIIVVMRTSNERKFYNGIRYS